MTISATTTICTAAHRCAADCHAVLVLFLGHQQLCGNHDQREAADQLEIWQPHQCRDDAGEDDAQYHGRGGAEDQRPTAAASALQSAACQRNHQCVVAGQQHVDPDDLADRKPECRLLHFVVELGEKRPDIRRIEISAACPTQSSQPAAAQRSHLFPDQPTISLPEKTARSRSQRFQRHPSRAPNFRRSILRAPCGWCRRPPWTDRSSP